MDTKEIIARLEIVKYATSIGDHDTIIIQNNFLRSANNNKLNEIVSLLGGRNYRQALYLIKGYLGEVDAQFAIEDDEERILDIEDMLKMSPLARETIKDYKRSAYTEDDLEAFAKNIEKPVSEEYNNINDNKIHDIPFIEDIENKSKKTEEPKKEKIAEVEISEQEQEDINEALKSADKDTPLDEISSEVLGNRGVQKKRKNVLSKYKNIREKFAKKTPQNKEEKEKFKSSSVAQNILSKVKEKSNTKDKKQNTNDKRSNSETDNAKNIIENINNSEKTEEKVISSKESANTLRNNKAELDTNKKSKSKELQKTKKSIEDSSIIYAPIPHIEHKFRQSFILYPPLKESDIWVAEAIKFLKNVSKNSFTEADVKYFLKEFDFYMEKKDVARASQILLLASNTESKHAQFMLARELFSGKVLVRDLKKSFVIMKSLANDFYPEAVCDLGQFYEYGIGVNKDRKIAIKLYEKAFELGVSRATRHINRLKESNGILSTIFKIK